MITKKLSDAFNDCAGKIINAEELVKFSFAEYANKLTKKELDLVTSFTNDPSVEAELANEIMSMLIDDVKREKLIAAVGDGTVGMYASPDGKVFMNVNFVKFLGEAMEGNRKLLLPPALEKKVNNADADALRKATDYKNKAVALGLKPVM